MPECDAHIWETSIAEWPVALTDLCLPFQNLDISKGDQEALIVLSGGKVAWEASMLSDDFVADLDTALQIYPNGAHIRFDLCSLKLGRYPPRIFTSKDFLSVLSRENSRISSSLTLFEKSKKDAHLFIFPWQDIPPWAEFRLFIRDRKIAGVSQYHHEHSYPEIQENLGEIKASLLSFARPLINALHMDTVVADVFVTPRDDGSFSTTLIELNPYIMRTDACLYSWERGGDFDGGIRYRKLRYNPYRNTTSAGKSAEPLGLFREEDYRRV